MRVTRKNWWTQLTTPIVGFDDDGQGEGDGQGAAQEGAGEGEGAQEGDGEGDAGTEDVTGLKSALEKERADRKKLDKELATFRKAQQLKDDAEKTEVERLKGESERERNKTTKLAQGFRDSAVRSAVLEAAGKAKFLDPSDALRPEVIAAIGVEQDEDDPSKVTIDASTVDSAVKKLATDRKHYIASDTKTTTKSGSSFAGGASPAKGDVAKAELLKKYPVLRGL